MPINVPGQLREEEKKENPLTPTRAVSSDPVLDEMINVDPEPEPGNFKEKQVGSFLLGKEGLLASQDQITSNILGLSDQVRTDDANNIIKDTQLSTEQKAEQVGQIAQSVNEPDPDTATVGMGRKLAQGEQVPDYTTDIGAFLDRQKKSVKEINDVFTGFIDSQRDKTQVTESGQIAGSTALGAAVSSLRETTQAARSFLFPDYSIELVNIVSKYSPKFKTGDYLADSDLMNSVAAELRNMPPEEARMAAKDITNSIGESAGTIFGNEYEARIMAQEVIQAVNEGQGLLNNTFQVLDVLSLLPVAGTTLAAGIKGGGAIARGVGQATRAGGAGEAVGAAARGGREAVSVFGQATLRELGLSGRGRQAEPQGRSPEEQVEEVVRNNQERAAEINRKTEEVMEEARKTGVKIEEAMDQLDELGKKGPRIPKGTPADVATSTTRGAREALENTETPEGHVLLENGGTAPEDVVNDLQAPKLDVDRDAMGRPYIEDNLLTPEEREILAERATLDLQERFSTRLKDTQIEDIDGGLRYTVALGKSSDSKGFASESVAKGQAKKIMGDQPHEIVESNGQWFIQAKGVYDNDFASIQSETELVRRGWFWRQMLGKNNSMTEAFIKMSGAATRNSTRAERKARELGEPYTKLGSGQKTKVNNALENSEREGRYFDDGELDTYGLTSQNEKNAYRAVENVAKADLDMANFNARRLLLDEGFDTATTVKGNEAFIRKVNEGERLRGGSKLFNSSTGNIVNPSAKKTGDRVYELFEPTKGGITHVLVRSGATLENSRPLPSRVVRNVGGYLPRHYQYPFYIRDLEKGKAVAGARSEKEARAYYNIDDEKYSLKIADEISQGDIAEFDDLTSLRSQGLLKTSRRRPDIIEDVTGGVKMRGVEESVNYMIRRYGQNAGMNRLNRTMMERLNRRYGHSLGIEFNLASRPRLTKTIESNETKRQEFEEASAIWRHVARNAGVNAEELIPDIQGARNSLAKVFWNRNSKMSQWLGDQVSGLDNAAQTGVKSAVFGAYLGSNFLRNPLLQSSMVPTYTGVRGGAKYALSGRFMRDFLTLSMANTPGGRQAAQKLDPELTRMWDESGLNELVDEHIFTIGTMTDSRMRPSSKIDDSFGRAFRAMKASGFDLGIRAEKRGAFLMSLNRFRVDNGRLPSNEREFQDVVTFSEQLSMNQNRSDVLPFTKGTAGMLTQFLSHQFKYTGRMVSNVAGGESGFSRRESIQMMAWNLLSYGMDGFRLGEIIDQGEAEFGVEMDPQLKEFALEGLYGTMLDAAMRGVTGEGMVLDEDLIEAGLQGDTDISGSISPANFTGPNAQNLADLFSATAGVLSLGQWKPDVQVTNYEGFGTFNFPAWGLGKSMGEVVNYGWMLSGMPTTKGFSPTEKTLAITEKFFKQFPVTDNAMKALIAANSGHLVDSEGKPSMEAALSEAIWTAAGFDTRDQNEINQGYQELLGDYVPETYDGKADVVRRHANNMAPVIVETLNSLGAEERNGQEVRELLWEHAVAHNSLIDDEGLRREYYSTLQDEVFRQGSGLRNEQFVNTILDELGRGNLIPNGDLVESIRALDFRGRDQLIRIIEDQQDISGVLGNMIQEEREE